MKCPACEHGEIGDDGRCSAIDCSSYEDLHTSYERKMLCPWCGEEQYDIYEIEDAHTDGEIVRVECGSCSRPFDSYCMVSYAFTTSRVDLVVEAEKKRIEDEARAKRLAERFAACSVFTPGMRVRVTSDRYTDFIRDRVGVVNDDPISPHNPFVRATLEPTDHDPEYEMSFFPDDLTVIP
jgi:hypothetical protein